MYLVLKDNGVSLELMYHFLKQDQTKLIDTQFYSYISNEVHIPQFIYSI